MPAGRLVVEESDDDYESESSFEDINNLLQRQSAAKYSGSATNGSESSRNTRVRNKGKVTSFNTPPPKPKYRFTMEALIKQAEIHKAAEESALSMKALLEDNAQPNSQGNSPDVARDKMLESVVARREGTDVEKFLRAVKRTEAISSEKRWYSFDITKHDIRAERQFPRNTHMEGWKAKLADPKAIEQVILSGFARDLVSLGDALPNEALSWMLTEICLEHREDLREAYSELLVASTEQLRDLMSTDTIINLFKTLGSTEAAIRIDEKVRPVSIDHSPYGGHDWTPLRAVITFIGRISGYLSLETSLYILSLFLRLSVDGVFVENISLLSAIQRTMEQVSANVGGTQWEIFCRDACSSVLRTVEINTLQLQILRCIPQTTLRLHAFRRQLALAFFFSKNVEEISTASDNTLLLWKVSRKLAEPRFEINKDTNYPELASLMSILDIAIDNGLPIKHDIVMDREGEASFNKEVDDLAARIKQIWGSINDAGASFMSRINAKEVIQGLRMRLEHSIRTRPKPKLSIFERDLVNDEEEVQRASAFMEKHFQKKPAKEDSL